LNINAAFRHYSNGKLNMPNNGMNFPVIGLGLRYVPEPEKVEFKPFNGTSEIDQRIYFNVMGSMSWREVLKEDFKHKAYSISTYASRQVSKYNTLLVGIDGFYYDDESVKRATNVHIAKNPGESQDQSLDGRQLALTLGSELLLGELSLILQGGIYLYKPQPYYANWYQRYGFKYNVTNFSFAQVTLKAHSRTADMMEFGIGFRI
ncbi:MAG: acyloxyacyl hydrolase, partial [Bacteroidota bacterium]